VFGVTHSNEPKGGNNCLPNLFALDCRAERSDVLRTLQLLCRGAENSVVVLKIWNGVDVFKTRAALATDGTTLVVQTWRF
jgi:hypothetical protein